MDNGNVRITKRRHAIHAIARSHTGSIHRGSETGSVRCLQREQSGDGLDSEQNRVTGNGSNNGENMGFLTVRVAERTDWPLIEAWRTAHFKEIAKKSRVIRGVIGQHGFDDAVWIVMDRYGKTVAALSYTDDEQEGIRWIWDLYAEEGHSLAGLALYETIERMCDERGYEVRGRTDPENIKFLKLVVRRGYELVSVEFRRQPRGKYVGV